MHAAPTPAAPPRPMRQSLVDLFDYLDNLTERASIPELRRLLGGLDDVTLDDFADHVRFGADRYQRNLVRSGPMYHALILCWRSGQRSPIHDHAKSTCGLRVLKGVSTETTFERTPSGVLKAVASADAPEGHVCASQDDDTHQISNLQAPGQDLITLHIYSPALVRMSTYSLTDGSVTEYTPVIFEHIHGSGI